MPTLPAHEDNNSIVMAKSNGVSLCMMLIFTCADEKLMHVYGGRALKKIIVKSEAPFSFPS